MKILRLFNKTMSAVPVVAVRVVALFSIVVWLITPAVVSLVTYAQGRDVDRDRRESDAAAMQQYVQTIQNEHRFSVLETKISTIDDRTSFLQNTMWGLIIGMSGLLGERGISIAKRRINSTKGVPNDD